MTAVGVYLHVNRAYETSESNQWAREAVVNSIQANAKNISFGVEWAAVAALDVFRRTIVDDGDGMQAQQMPAFLNKFGGSGRTIGDITGNYGVGFKTSCLPWNQNGVVIISVTTDLHGKKHSNMMWMKAETTPTGVDYGARELVTEFFEAEDAEDMLSEWVMHFGDSEDAMTVLPLDRLKDWGYREAVIDGVDWFEVVPKEMLKRGHGTMIVLLGNDGHPHTIMGDPSRDEGRVKYGLVRYLNTRFYSLPKDVTVKVTTLGPDIRGEKREVQEGSEILVERGWGDPKYWPRSSEATGESGVNNRTILGMQACLSRYDAVAKKAGGKVYTENTEIKLPQVPVPVTVMTTLWPDIGQTKEGGWNHYQSGDQPSIPLFANLSESHPGIVEAFDVKMLSAGKQALWQWVNLDSVRKRLCILAMPHNAEDVIVFPDQSRRTLLYQDKLKGGTPVPVKEWADAYRTMRPTFISDAVTAFFRSNADDVGMVPEDFIKKLGYYSNYFCITVLRRFRKRSVKTDDEEVVEGSNNGGGGGDKAQPNSNREVKSGGIVRRVRLGLIMAYPDGPSKAPSEYPIEWNFDDQERPKLLVNMQHTLIQDAWQICEDKLRGDGVDDVELEAYRKAFNNQTLAHVSLSATHIWKFLSSGSNIRLKDKLTSPEAALSMVAGVRPLQQAAQGSFGTLKAGRLAKK